MRWFASVGCLWLLALAAAAQVVVGSYYNSAVLDYSPTGGGLQATYIPAGGGGTGLLGPAGLTLGPDQNLYISSQFNNKILKYDFSTGTTSVFIDTPALQALVPPGESYSPAGLRFGPDGHLYVARNLGNTAFPFTGAVDRFHGSSGSHLGVVASGLSQPVSLTVQGNDLFVSNLIGPNPNAYGSVQRIAGFTGAAPTVSNFITTNLGGLENPTGTAFGPDNKFYVADVGGSSNGFGCAVRRYNLDGTFDTVFALPDGQGNGNLAFQFPADLAFREDGKLLVANLGFSNNPANLVGSIMLFNGVTGVYEQTLATGLAASALAIIPIPEPALLALLPLAGWSRRRWLAHALAFAASFHRWLARATSFAQTT